MQSVAFDNGLACGLLLAGVAFEKVSGEGASLQNVKARNGDYYIGEEGFGCATLFTDDYRSVLSSWCFYMPSSGAVCLGGWSLVDWNNPWTQAAAMIRVTIDDEVVYEGDVYEYFNYYEDYSTHLRDMKTIVYKEWFSIDAKRVVADTTPTLEIFDIVALSI